MSSMHFARFFQHKAAIVRFPKVMPSFLYDLQGPIHHFLWHFRLMNGRPSFPPSLGLSFQTTAPRRAIVEARQIWSWLNPAESLSPMGITCWFFFLGSQCWTNPTDSKTFRDSEGRIRGSTVRRCRRCRSYMCRYPVPRCVWYRFSLVASGALMIFNVFVKPRHSKYLIYMAQMLHAQDKFPIFTVALNITQM